MNVLVTSGSTRTMIDQVRCISNIFGGRTGFEIAKAFRKAGDSVVLLTSNKQHAKSFKNHHKGHSLTFQTYDELYESMKREIEYGLYDVIIHSAAVSDYQADGTYVLHDGDKQLDMSLERIDDSGKVGSDHKELFLRLVPTEKIVDRIREWGFGGVLVKFKLQVDMTDQKLVQIATSSMNHSNANVMVANCLEWSRDRAFIISEGKDPIDTPRKNLPEILRVEIEHLLKKL